MFPSPSTAAMCPRWRDSIIRPRRTSTSGAGVGAFGLCSSLLNGGWPCRGAAETGGGGKLAPHGGTAGAPGLKATHFLKGLKTVRNLNRDRRRSQPPGGIYERASVSKVSNRRRPKIRVGFGGTNLKAAVFP
jgi:hypothetical protein